MERLFQQGADVKAGDILYRIDPARFEVELRSANAALAKAHAVLEQAEKHAKRIERLAVGQVASQAQYENGMAALRQAQADVSARQADVDRAKLDLDYTIVRSPISGRIGPALVTEGALVGQGEATHLATVQQLDPIYADFTQSVSELRQLRRDLESGALEQISPRVCKGSPRAGRWKCLSLCGPAAVLRCECGPVDKSGHFTRRISKCETGTVAGHVCSHSDRAGNRRRRARGSAAVGSAH